MLRLLADEDFNNAYVRALRRRCPGVNVTRVQDVGLSGQPDEMVLAWAAAEGRVLLTHDAATLVGHALARLTAGQPLAGVLVVPQSAPAGAVVDDLELIVTASESEDWAERVVFLPYR